MTSPSSDIQAPAIEFTDAAIQIGGRRIWAHCNLTVGQGEFCAVLGPNGAGKSSLVRAVLGLLPLSAGTGSVLSAAPGDANDRIGYLPQRRTFDSSVRIRGIDVVRMGLDGHRWGMPLPRFLRGETARTEARRLAEVIELVGATSYATRPIGEVSGGEQQRLLIAQALVRRPQLLLLDEPLDSLDLPNQHAVASLVRDICQDARVTVLMVAHDVNPIVSYLDQVIYVAGGSVTSGTPRDVVRTDVLTELYNTPIDVLETPDGRLVVVGAPDGHTHHAHG